MLILTRKPSEAIYIGDDVKIVVLGFHRGEVRLGIKAPPHVVVHREEVQERIEAERDEQGAA